MQTIEFEATIDSSGVIRLPQEYQEVYGREARFVALLRGNISAENETEPDTPVSTIVNHPAVGMWADREGDSRDILNRIRQEQWTRP